MNRKLAALSLLTLASALVVPACVGGSSDVSKQEKERLKAYILNKAPPDIPNKLNINYDNKVTLLGCRVEPKGTLRPGQQVKITMYWRSDKKLPDGWNLFTHVLDGSGERVMNIDNVGPLREWHGTHQVLWPSAWTPGKVYVDEQTFNVPSKLKTNKIQVVTGIWKGNSRLKTLSGPHDAQNRGIVANIMTTVNEKPGSTLANASVPMIRVNKLEKGETIKIDGKLDDPAWKTAPVAGPFVDVNTGKPNTTFPMNGSVKLAWNDQGLYLGFTIQDPNIIGGFKPGAKDPHLWTKDTVEIMIEPDAEGDNKDYYEIQINPQNLVFDTQYDTYNEPRTLPNGPFGHENWSSHVKSAVTVNGTIDKPGDKDKGYVVEAMIPWKSFTLAKHSPPRLGDIWRMNFYAMKHNGGVAWSPILRQGNFHKASRFGRVLWAAKGWHPPGMQPPAMHPPAIHTALKGPHSAIAPHIEHLKLQKKK